MHWSSLRRHVPCAEIAHPEKQLDPDIPVPNCYPARRPFMRAEAQKLSDTIKEAFALLRRSL